MTRLIIVEVLRGKVARRKIIRLGDDQIGEEKDRQRSSKAQHCEKRSGPRRCVLSANGERFWTDVILQKKKVIAEAGT